MRKQVKGKSGDNRDHKPPELLHRAKKTLKVESLGDPPSVSFLGPRQEDQSCRAKKKGSEKKTY